MQLNCHDLLLSIVVFLHVLFVVCTYFQLLFFLIILLTYLYACLSHVCLKHHFWPPFLYIILLISIIVHPFTTDNNPPPTSTTLLYAWKFEYAKFISMGTLLRKYFFTIFALAFTSDLLEILEKMFPHYYSVNHEQIFYEFTNERFKILKKSFIL